MSIHTVCYACGLENLSSVNVKIKSQTIRRAVSTVDWALGKYSRGSSYTVSLITLTSPSLPNALATYLCL